MVREKIFLIFIFLIILMSLPALDCNASESSFVIKEDYSLFISHIADAFTSLRDCIIDADDILIRCLFEIPKPQRSNIFNAIDEINRSIAETSTCL